MKQSRTIHSSEESLSGDVENIMNIKYVHFIATFLTASLFNLTDIFAEESLLHPTFRNVVSAEVSGMGREWKVESSKEITKLLSFFTMQEGPGDFGISIPQFNVQLKKSDGTTSKLYISGGLWITSDAEISKETLLMSENWHSYFWDPKNHNPSIRRARYAIVELQRKEQQKVMMDKLSSITVDKINFQNTDLDKVVSLLVAKSRVNDPDGEGVNIAFNDPDYVTDQDGYEIPQISVKLHSMSLLNTIRTIANLSNRDVLYQQNLIVVGKPKLLARVYTILPGVTQINLESIETDVKAKMKSHGVNFPPGTSITHHKGSHQFFIIHTEEAFPVIEDVWLSLNSHSFQKSSPDLKNPTQSQP
jgi:hypothetical protein